MSNRALTWAFNVKVGNQFAKLVLISLADNADDEARQCWPSAQYIADRCEMSVRAVYYAIAFLKKHGFLEVEHRQWPGGTKRSPRYTILFPQENSQLHNMQNLLHTSAEPSAPACSSRTLTEPSQRNGKAEFGIWISRYDHQRWSPWEAHYRNTKGVRPPTTTSNNDLGWWFPTEAPPALKSGRPTKKA